MVLRRTELFIKYAYRNNSIKPPPGGGAYSKLDLREGGAYSKGSFPEGGLIRDAYYGLRWLVVPGKYIAKGPKKRLKVLKK